MGWASLAGFCFCPCSTLFLFQPGQPLEPASLHRADPQLCRRRGSHVYLLGEQRYILPSQRQTSPDPVPTRPPVRNHIPGPAWPGHRLGQPFGAQSWIILYTRKTIGAHQRQLPSTPGCPISLANRRAGIEGMWPLDRCAGRAWRKGLLILFLGKWDCCSSLSMRRLNCRAFWSFS